MTSSHRTALLLGATGLVGGHCLDRLLQDDGYAQVVSLGRRPLDRTHPKLRHHVVDLARPETYEAFLDVQDVFCCLGTTIKQAGSQEAFRRVDFEYPVQVARRARERGAGQYLLVSALGASLRSPFFYSRVKGEVEAAVEGLGYTGVYIFRPSLLRGDREEARAGERIAENVLDRMSFALRGPFRQYRPTLAADVAAAMVKTARVAPGGVRVLEPEEIEAVAQAGEHLT